MFPAIKALPRVELKAAPEKRQLAGKKPLMYGIVQEVTNMLPDEMVTIKVKMVRVEG